MIAPDLFVCARVEISPFFVCKYHTLATCFPCMQAKTIAVVCSPSQRLMLCSCSSYLCCEVMPKLMKSCLGLFGFRPICATKKHEAYYNFKLSVRGSIRQAPSCITWLLMLQNLRKGGLTDATSIIKEWNETSGKSSALIGGKAQAVKFLIEKAPQCAVDFLAAHVSAWGWGNCAFSDDGLASKRTYPGNVFKHARPGWNDRCRVNEQVFELYLQYSVSDWVIFVPNTS